MNYSWFLSCTSFYNTINSICGFNLVVNLVTTDTPYCILAVNKLVFVYILILIYFNFNFVSGSKSMQQKDY